MEEQEPISIAEARTVLDRALLAIISGDIGAVDVFTDDVIGDSPSMSVHSRAELENQLFDRARALSNVEFSLDRLEQVGSNFVATWQMSGDHTGEVLLNEDEYFEPTGLRLELSATTQVQFREGRICAFQTTYQGPNPIDQLRRRSAPGAP